MKSMIRTFSNPKTETPGHTRTIARRTNQKPLQKDGNHTQDDVGVSGRRPDGRGRGKVTIRMDARSREVGIRLLLARLSRMDIKVSGAGDSATKLQL